STQAQPLGVLGAGGFPRLPRRVAGSSTLDLTLMKIRRVALALLARKQVGRAYFAALAHVIERWNGIKCLLCSVRWFTHAQSAGRHHLICLASFEAGI